MLRAQRSVASLDQTVTSQKVKPAIKTQKAGLDKTRKSSKSVVKLRQTLVQPTASSRNKVVVPAPCLTERRKSAVNLTRSVSLLKPQCSYREYARGLQKQLRDSRKKLALGLLERTEKSPLRETLNI